MKIKLGYFSLIGASASCSSYQHPRRDRTRSSATGTKQLYARLLNVCLYGNAVFTKA
jgi:hypothetical protein